MSNHVTVPLGGNPPATDLFGVAASTNAEPRHADVCPASDERQPPATAQSDPSNPGCKTRPAARAVKPAAARLPRLLTIPEVAAYLKISTKTVRRWIERGELHAYRVGRQLRIAEEDLSVCPAYRRL